MFDVDHQNRFQNMAKHILMLIHNIYGFVCSFVLFVSFVCFVQKKFRPLLSKVGG